MPSYAQQMMPDDHPQAGGGAAGGGVEMGGGSLLALLFFTSSLRTNERITFRSAPFVVSGGGIFPLAFCFTCDGENITRGRGNFRLCTPFSQKIHNFSLGSHVSYTRKPHCIVFVTRRAAHIIIT